MAKTKQDLRDYLDWYDFVNQSEISDAVLEFMEEEMWVLNPSYQDCLNAGEYADEYIELRWIKFYDVWDIVK